MGRKTSFKEQMFRCLNSKNCFGKSKHLAKIESYRSGNKGVVDGIYSKKTMQDYKKVAQQFHSWQKDKGYNFHSMKEVDSSILKQYLLERQSQGLSPWTISHDLSALNKIFETSISKKDCGLAPRRTSCIKNNRGLAQNYRPSVQARNKDMIAFISACGVRRQSLSSIAPGNSIRDKQNMVIGFSVIEKGGKHRNCYVRSEYQKEITSFVDNHIKNYGNAPFWKKVDKNLNTHWYRGVYAKGLYQGLLNAKENGLDYFKGYKDLFINQSKFANAIKGHSQKVKGYDVECLAMVSQNMGHNRIDVVYTNYLGHIS